MKTLSVVIPAFNEENAVADVIHATQKALSDLQGWNWEIIVVDDGSEDQTAQRAQEADARVIQQPLNRGYGASLKKGIWASEADFIAITDADGTYPVERLPDLLTQIDNGADMAVGRRTGQHYWSSLIKNPLRVIYMWLCSFAAGGAIPDGNSGLRVFRRSDVLKNEAHLCMGFSFTTSLSLAMVAADKDVRWVEVDYMARVGKSKVRLFRDGLRTAQYILQTVIRFNPVKLALIPFSLFFSLGFLTLIWSLFDSKFPTPLGWVTFVICLSVGASIFSLGCLAYASSSKN